MVALEKRLSNDNTMEIFPHLYWLFSDNSNVKDNIGFLAMCNDGDPCDDDRPSYGSGGSDCNC